MQQTRVAIVEPQALVREGLSLILAAVDDVKVVAQGDAADDVTGIVAMHRPDVLCLAVRLTDGDARDVIASIRELGEPSPVILLLIGRKDAELIDSLRASDGVGVLSKYSTPEVIVRAVRAAGERGRQHAIALSQLMTRG